MDQYFKLLHLACRKNIYIERNIRDELITLENAQHINYRNLIFGMDSHNKHDLKRWKYLQNENVHLSK